MALDEDSAIHLLDQIKIFVVQKWQFLVINDRINPRLAQGITQVRDFETKLVSVLLFNDL